MAVAIELHFGDAKSLAGKNARGTACRQLADARARKTKSRQQLQDEMESLNARIR